MHLGKPNPVSANLEIRKYEESITDFDRVLAIKPSDLIASTYRDIAHARMNNRENPFADLKKIAL